MGFLSAKAFLFALSSGDPLAIVAVGGLVVAVGMGYAFQKRGDRP